MLMERLAMGGVGLSDQRPKTGLAACHGEFKPEFQAFCEVGEHRAGFIRDLITGQLFLGVQHVAVPEPSCARREEPGPGPFCTTVPA